MSKKEVLRSIITGFVMAIVVLLLSSDWINYNIALGMVAVMVWTLMFVMILSDVHWLKKKEMVDYHIDSIIFWTFAFFASLSIISLFLGCRIRGIDIVLLVIDVIMICHFWKRLLQHSKGD